MRRRAPQAAPPNQPLYPTARPPPPTAAMAATSPYSAAGGFAQAPLAGGSLYPTRVAQQQYGLNSSIDGRDDYGSSGAEGSKDWQQTALLHGRWALRGWRDAARPARVFEMISSDAHLRASVVRSMLINIPVLVGLLFLTTLILPLLSTASPSGRGPGGPSRPSVIAWALNSTYLWEAVGMAVVVLANGRYQGLIAERAFGGGRSAGIGGKGIGSGGSGSSLATRTIILLDYLIVTSTLHLIPWLGWPLATIYSLFVNSFYVFNWSWSAKGFTLDERLTFLQTRWAYLAGFGAPLTLLSTLPFLPALAQTSLYATFYPLFLILASVSEPVPSASGSFSNLPLSGGEEAAGLSGAAGGESGGGIDGGAPEGWSRRMPALEGARWAVGAWERLSGELGDAAASATGGTGGGHRRRGSRFA